jgi:hypothetical protein
MRRSPPLQHAAAAVLLVLTAASGVLAWSAHGHRAITYLALDGLPTDAPDWLRDPSIRHRIADQSNEPDRWRGTPTPPLAHENDPDHYIDIEDLAQFGLTLPTVSPYRYEYLRDMAIAKQTHPESVAPYDSAADKDHTREWPGFLPHAITEHYAKLRACFNTYRILAELNDPVRADQLEQARQNCIFEMGILSHFVADASQPLHTTKHHHGWVGDNPNGYTTDRGFHAYIDSGVVELHGYTAESLRPLVRFTATVDADNPWQDTLQYINRSFELVQPLYRLKRDGDLEKAAGKAFIAERLTDAASMLAALYSAAWTSSAPDERQIQAWVRYNNFKPELLPNGTGSVSPK